MGKICQSCGCPCEKMQILGQMEMDARAKITANFATRMESSLWVRHPGVFGKQVAIARAKLNISEDKAREIAGETPQNLSGGEAENGELRGE